jgi:hypothetical protein
MGDYSPPVSYKIQKVVEHWVKLGRRSQVYKLADKVVRMKYASDVLLGMEIVATALSKTETCEKPNVSGPIWLVKIEKNYLFFYGKTEEEAIQRFDQLKPIKALPDKVLVRMLIEKMHRIKYAMQRIEKRSEKEDIEEAKSILNGGLGSIEKCVNACNFAAKNEWWLEDIKNFVSEPRNNREDLFQEAWNNILVGDVIES